MNIQQSFIHSIIGGFDHSKLELLQKGLNIEFLMERDGHLLQYIASPNSIPCPPATTCINYYFGFSVSGIQAELSGYLYFRVSHKTAIKVLVEAMNFSRLTWRKIYFQVHSLGRSQKSHYEADSWGLWQVLDSLLAGFIHSRHVKLSVELIMMWKLASLPTSSEIGEGETKKERRKWKSWSFCSDILYLCHVLFVRRESAGPAHTGDEKMTRRCECRRCGSLGPMSRLCAPPTER